MQKLVTKVALCRLGVKMFENEVNAYLADGWALEEYDVEPHFLRIVCSALLEKDDCSCDCCEETCKCECPCCKTHSEEE